MTENILEKLFEHNNWANLQMIQACSTLSDEQLDAEPHSVTKGSIRRTLMHLVNSQHGYLSLLTLPVEARVRSSPTFAELSESVSISGEALSALARDGSGKLPKVRLQTTDGYWVEPSVIMVQIVNPATENREQLIGPDVQADLAQGRGLAVVYAQPINYHLWSPRETGHD